MHLFLITLPKKSASSSNLTPPSRTVDICCNALFAMWPSIMSTPWLCLHPLTRHDNTTIMYSHCSEMIGYSAPQHLFMHAFSHTYGIAELNPLVIPSYGLPFSNCLQAYSSLPALEQPTFLSFPSLFIA